MNKTNKQLISVSSHAKFLTRSHWDAEISPWNLGLSKSSRAQSPSEIMVRSHQDLAMIWKDTNISLRLPTMHPDCLHLVYIGRNLRLLRSHHNLKRHSHLIEIRTILPWSCWNCLHLAKIAENTGLNQHHSWWEWINKLRCSWPWSHSVSQFDSKYGKCKNRVKTFRQGFVLFTKPW